MRFKPPNTAPILPRYSSVAVNILAQQGYTVAASTGKADQHDYLRELGASEILSREDVSLTDERPRPLLKGT